MTTPREMLEAVSLPELPEPRVVSYQTDGAMRTTELRTYTDSDMHAYARAYGAAIAASLEGQAERSVCSWLQEDHGSDWFNTSCGNTFIVNDSETSGMTFCVYCGGRMEAKLWTDDDEADEDAARSIQIADKLAHSRAHDSDGEAVADDTARLDWLERHCVNVADEYGTGAQLYFGTYGTAPLRDAIDAARSTQSEDETS